MESPLSKSNNKVDGREPCEALTKALQVLVSALRLSNGSLKVYVRDGKASPRVEVQTDLSTVIKI